MKPESKAAMWLVVLVVGLDLLFIASAFASMVYLLKYLGVL